MSGIARKTITTPTRLYRHLLKCVRQLPENSQSHYKHSIRQGFVSHSDETDPERIQQIIQRALEDAEWLLQKYAKDK